MRKRSLNQKFSWWLTGAFLLVNLCTLTVQGSITHSRPDFQCDQVQDSDIEHWVRTLPGSHTQFNEREFLFGEEFEFWIEGAIVPPGYKKTPYPNNLASAQLMVMKWAEALINKLEELEIEDYTIQKYLNTGYVPAVSEHWIDIRIGEWKNTIYIDGWLTPDKTGLALLEVNTSPYRMHQTFKVGKKRYTAYELFDLFIFDIAKELDLKGASGHKHLDLRDSVGGNQELMFRMLVDAESKAWLSQLFGCEEDSGMKFGCFVYRAQNGQNQTCSSALQTLVNVFNDSLISGVHDKQSHLTPGHSLQQIMKLWRCALVPEGQILPLEIRMSTQYDPDIVTNERAKKGDVVVHPQCGTAEFRFLPAVQSGKEVLLINKMLRNWFRYQAERQRDGFPIVYEPYDPRNNEETPESLKQRFKDFIKTIGLPPSKYKVLNRKGCARSSYNYYD